MRLKLVMWANKCQVLWKGDREISSKSVRLQHILKTTFERVKMSSDVKQGNSLQCSADLPHILFYNNEEDIDKLIVNLKKILQ